MFFFLDAVSAQNYSNDGKLKRKYSSALLHHCVALARGVLIPIVMIQKSIL
jgi:hypothetical protein